MTDTPPVYPLSPYPPPPEASDRPTRRRRVRLISAAIAALVVAAGLLAYFQLAGGSSSAGPKDAVSGLLDAGKGNDLGAAKRHLCAADNAAGVANQLAKGAPVRSYTIGTQNSRDGLTYVTASVVTTDEPTPAAEDYPVVKEAGEWKVCLTRGGAFGTPGSGAANLPSVPVPALPSGAAGQPGGPSLPTSLQSSLPNGVSVCAGARNSLSVAVTYMQAAEVGFGSFAQSCVYPNTVSQATTDRIAGKLYAPATKNANATSVPFRSTDGTSTVTVTVAKRDGKFYVVGVRLG
jgi:hypothetical protein